jgi:hybrid polyketide synthase/nonribosomal peptide synthetase ACE1
MYHIDFYITTVVLEDTPFRDMSLETLLKATRPKVEGSLHLNELFQENTLDFFVFFSSASAIPGNLGQANYSTANLFMTALAEQRRQRGLAASIMHIGPIFGVGYIAQQGITAGIQSLAEIFVPLSEQDFYQHFAETIVAGKPGSNSALEITTGVAKVGSPADASPFMSHYTKSREIVNLDASTAKSDVPVKIQLSNARGQAQVSRIIRGVLLPKLAALFQTDLDKLEKADLDKLRLDEMGIDSLLAVEIRSWFVKTLEVNIPVLKILSGVPVAELISIATETIPPSLVPNINEESTVNPEFDKQPEPLVPKQEPQQPKKLWSEAKQLEPLVSKTVQPQPKKLWSEAILPEEVESKHVSSSSGSETNLNFDFSPPDYSNGSMSPLDDDNESLSSFVSCDHPIYEEEKALLAPKPALEKSVKLSFGQSLFWFVSAFSKDQTSLNLTGSFRLTGKLRIQDLQKAVEAIGQQHESLRTCFFEQDDQPLQGIMKSSPLGLECHQIHDEKEVTDYFAQIHNYIYDLKGGKTIRLALLSLSPTEHFFIMGAHHLAMDGLSFQVFMKDLLQNYTYGYQNHIPRQYAECSEKQHADFAAGKLGNDLQFWKTELAELPPTLPILRLSTAISRPALSVYGNERVDIRIAPEIKKQLQNVCRRCRATPFHFYLAVFRALLWRYTSAEHISIGIGDANRTDDDMMGSIGDFVNVLPLQFRTQSSARFETLLQETRTKTYAALAHSKVPFQVLLNE